MYNPATRSVSKRLEVNLRLAHSAPHLLQHLGLEEHSCDAVRKDSITKMIDRRHRRCMVDAMVNDPKFRDVGRSGHSYNTDIM